MDNARTLFRTITRTSTSSATSTNGQKSLLHTHPNAKSTSHPVTYPSVCPNLGTAPQSQPHPQKSLHPHPCSHPYATPHPQPSTHPTQRLQPSGLEAGWQWASSKLLHDSDSDSELAALSSQSSVPSELDGNPLRAACWRGKMAELRQLLDAVPHVNAVALDWWQ